MAQQTYSKEKVNFFKVAEGLAYVGAELEKYTLAGLTKVHQTIYRKLAHEPPCQLRCSEAFGKNFQQWCTTCQQWRKHLENSCRYKVRNLEIEWKQMHSWTWQNDPVSIAEVYLAKGWTKHLAKIDLVDVSTALLLWDNCVVYKIAPNTIKKLREIRNFYFAHNSNMGVTDDKLKTAFMVFNVLFRDSDLGDLVDVNKCVKDLQQIRQKKDIDISLKELLQKINSQTEKLDQINLHLKSPERRTLQPIYTVIQKVLITFLVATVVVLIFLFIVKTRHQDQRETIKPSCLPESYSVPFTPEMQLEGYLIDRRKIVGRQWLVNEIDSKMFHRDFKKAGILITADMGYGKSAFISHLLCSSKTDPGYEFRKKILAYHLCRFDVLSTKNPALFIRRLVGMVGIQIPELGSIVSMLPNTSLIFDRQLCEQDPNGCFDQGFLFPIRNIKDFPKEKRIILIDALDECSDSFGGENRISELLRLRAGELPSWVVVLITSRNTSDIRLSKDTIQMHLSSSDHRNFEDIKKYVEAKMEFYAFKFKQLFEIKTDTTLVEKLVNYSDGNFLFLTHAFEYWYTFDGKFTDKAVPSSLDRIYELNFERIFGINEKTFQKAKLILEVVCASFYPLQEKELFKILQMRNYTFPSQSHFQETVEQLSMFLRNENNVLLFTHLSIRNWLLSKTSTKFSISGQNGAVIISEYLLHELQLQANNDTFNYTELAIHVSRSNSKSVVKMFMSITQDKTKQIVETQTLHMIVKIVDSPEAINLVARHYINIDQRNSENFTAACIAAMTGHIESLKRLVELGADINVTLETDLPPYHYYRFAEAVIHYYKTVHFPGYKLLHLASQFGHFSVVEFIVSKQKTQMYAKNHVGQLPLHLACEFGRKDVVEYFLLQEKITDDFSCLYFASKNQHVSVIKLILSLNNSQYQCVSETIAKEAYEDIRYLNETKDGMIIVSNILVRPLDVWWKLQQDSPLHVSVRNGNLHISILIASAIPGLLNCSDGGGLTPFLTSIIYQKTDIFKHFAKERFSDVCSGPSQITKKVGQILGHYTQMICDKNMTVSHFLALSGTREMIEYMVLDVAEIQFNVTYAQGVTPLHTAACSGNLYFLRAAHDLNADFGIPSKNGSTPYHSAISCHSYLGLYVMQMFRGIHSKRDNLNMSLGLYLVKEPKPTTENRSSDREIEIFGLYMLQLLINTSLEHITRRDNFKRNIFHYALRNGHYHYTQYLLDSRPKLSLMFLLQKDVDGYNPVAYAIKRLHESQGDFPYTHVFPLRCSYLDLFKNQECLNVTPLEQLMSPVELSLLYVMMQVKDAEVKTTFLDYFGEIVSYSKMYLVPYVLPWLANDVPQSRLKEEVMTAVEKGPAAYNILSIVLLKPELLIYCDDTFLDPPVHALLKHMDSILAVLAVNSDLFLKKIFKTKQRKNVLLHCLDRKQNNIIERAAEDNALNFVRRLTDVYQKVFNPLTLQKLLPKIIYLNLNTKSHRDKIRFRQKIREGILNEAALKLQSKNVSSSQSKREMVKSSSIWISHIFKLFSYHTKNQVTNLGLDVIKGVLGDNQNSLLESELWDRKDELIYKILVNFSDLVDLNVFCTERVLFSLVHLVAASDMHKTMSVLIDKAPFKVIHCTNRHGATPLYLAKVFKSEKTVTIMEKKIKLKLPAETFEETLLFKLLSNFVDSHTGHPLQRLHNNIPEYRSVDKYQVYRNIIKAMVGAKKSSIIYQYIYSKLFPAPGFRFHKIVASAFSLTQTIITARNDTSLCNRLKEFRKFFNLYQEHLYVFVDVSGKFFSFLPHHLNAYQQIWQNKTYFRKSEWCSTVKASLDTVLKVHFFSRSLMFYLLKTNHNLLFNFIMKEVKISLPSNELFREEVYFQRKREIKNFLVLRGTLRPKDFVQYKYLDILKGLYIKNLRQIIY